MAAYVLGQERDLEPLGLTPKDVLCKGSHRELQGLLYAKVGTRDYQDYVKSVQIRPHKSDPITSWYGVNSSVNRHPGWEEELVMAVVDQAERFEECLGWAQKALWP